MWYFSLYLGIVYICSICKTSYSYALVFNFQKPEIVLIYSNFDTSWIIYLYNCTLYFYMSISTYFRSKSLHHEKFTTLFLLLDYVGQTTLSTSLFTWKFTWWLSIIRRVYCHFLAYVYGPQTTTAAGDYLWQWIEKYCFGEIRIINISGYNICFTIVTTVSLVDLSGLKNPSSKTLEPETD